jgi:hypothetical protein
VPCPVIAASGNARAAAPAAAGVAADPLTTMGQRLEGGVKSR